MPCLEAANRNEQTTTQSETKTSCRKTHDNEEGIVETDRQPHHHPRQARFDALVNRAITSLNDQQQNKRINPTSNPKRPSIIQIARQARQLLNETEPGGYQFRKHGNLHELVSSYLERSGFHHGQEGDESSRKLSERRLNRSYCRFMNDRRQTRRHIVKRQRGPTPIINIYSSENVDSAAKDDYCTIQTWSRAPARMAHVNATRTVHISPHTPSVVAPRDSAPVLHDTTPHADADRQPTTPNDHNEDHGVNDIALVSLPPVSNDPGDDGNDTSIAPAQTELKSVLLLENGVQITQTLPRTTSLQYIESRKFSLPTPC